MGQKFLWQNISCRVTGIKRYSANLIQGGLEIPCRLILSASTKELIEMALMLLNAACMLDDGTLRDTEWPFRRWKYILKLKVLHYRHI